MVADNTFDAHAAAEHPSASPPVSAESCGCARLDADLAAFAALVALEPNSADDLAAALRAASAQIAASDLNDYDADGIRQNGGIALDDLFHLRVGLHDRVPAWLDAGLVTRSVEAGLRGVFRDGRYVTDMIGELVHGEVPRQVDGSDISAATTPFRSAFTGGPLHTVVNPASDGDGEVRFRSGDVLLVRGMLANSAAIARIGDIDSQFSHIGMVHVDESGETTIVEALIERGATITSLDDALAHGLARAVLLRPRDADLGRRAANRIKAHVARSLTSHAPHIPYDFTMEPDGYRALFCSKLVRLAYAAASNGALILPTFQTRLGMKNRSFFRQIGVTATETFAPADIELDPAFTLVAEWRDFRNTALIRNQDVVMDMIFHWMDTRNMQLKPTLKIKAIGWLGRIASYLPAFVKRRLSTVVPEVPRNMSRSTIEAVAMLDGVADVLTHEVMALDRETASGTGRPLHPRDAYAALDMFREANRNRISYLREAPRRSPRTVPKRPVK